MWLRLRLFGSKCQLRYTAFLVYPPLSANYHFGQSYKIQIRIFPFRFCRWWYRNPPHFVTKSRSEYVLSNFCRWCYRNPPFSAKYHFGLKLQNPDQNMSSPILSMVVPKSATFLLITTLDKVTKSF
jgi:hypothetical protein